MNIVIASTTVPFIKGGGTKIVDDLQQVLSRLGHRVDAVKIPMHWDWRELPEQYAAMRLFDLTRCGSRKTDLLIPIRYPSYALPHPNKVPWFIHHHRGAYDLYGTEFQDLPDNDEGRRCRKLLIDSDTAFLRESKRIFTNSRIVARRLKQFNDIDADGVLYPPLANPEPFQPGEFGDYIFYASRVTLIKRQALAIRAMRHVRSNFKLVIAGGPDAGYGPVLERLIDEYQVRDKVKLLGWISEEQKARWMADCFGALYLAFNEDSYGYVTLEAFHCHKPVITFSDSGGPLEVIEDGFNGLVSEPTEVSLAAAMEKLSRNRRAARELGHNAFATIRRHNIDWNHVVERLVA